MLQLRNNCLCAFSKPSCPAPARLSLFSKLFCKADIVHCSFLLTSQKKFFSNYPELLDGPEGIVVLPGNSDGSFIADSSGSKEDSSSFDSPRISVSSSCSSPNNTSHQPRSLFSEKNSLSPSLFPVSSPAYSTSVL